MVVPDYEQLGLVRAVGCELRTAVLLNYVRNLCIEILSLKRVTRDD